MGIYEDVVTLKEQMTEVQADISEMQVDIQLMAPKQLETGDDVNSLEEGLYYIPTTAVAAGVLNLPTTEHTGMIEVFPAGSNGQIIQRFTPFRKEYVNVYQRGYYNGSWGPWKFVDVTDSGWKILPLASGITAYSPTGTPQYRRIGDVVYIMGAVKGVTAADTLIGTLPEGYRPEIMNYVYVQNTSMASNKPNFARWVIKTTGEIRVEGASNGFAATNWLPLNTSFAV